MFRAKVLFITKLRFPATRTRGPKWSKAHARALGLSRKKFPGYIPGILLEGGKSRVRGKKGEKGAEKRMRSKDEDKLFSVYLCL